MGERRVDVLTSLRVDYHEYEAVAFWVATTLQWKISAQGIKDIPLYSLFTRSMPSLKDSVSRQFTDNFEEAMRAALEAWVMGRCVCSSQ